MDPPPQRSRLLTGTHCRSISLLCAERTFSICKHWCQNGGRQKRNADEESKPMSAYLGLEFLHLCHRENGPPRWDDDTRKATSYPEWSSMTLQAITTYIYIATGHALTPAHPFCPWPKSDQQVRTHTSSQHTKIQAHIVIEGLLWYYQKTPSSWNPREAEMCSGRAPGWLAVFGRLS